MYVDQALNPGSLAGDVIESLYDDGSGVLWVGTRYSGLNKLLLNVGSAGHAPVAQHSNNALDPMSLSGDMANGILEDHEGSLCDFWHEVASKPDEFQLP